MQLTGITPILNVSDIGASLAWFEKLGWRRCWTWNGSGSIEGGADANAAGPASFAAVSSGEYDLFLCRDAQGSRGGPSPRHVDADDDDTGGVWMSWWVATPAEVDAVYALAQSSGFTVARPPQDEPWGCREFHLRHPDGHTFRVASGVGDE